MKHAMRIMVHPTAAYFVTTHCVSRRLYVGSLARNAVMIDMSKRNITGANCTITA